MSAAVRGQRGGAGRRLQPERSRVSFGRQLGDGEGLGRLSSSGLGRREREGREGGESLVAEPCPARAPAAAPRPCWEPGGRRGSCPGSEGLGAEGREGENKGENKGEKE